MNEPLVIFLPGKARHLGFDSRLDARAIILRERPLVELLRDFFPEKGALGGEFNGAIGNAAEVGDVPLRRLAINSLALGQDSRPVGRRIRSNANARTRRSVPVTLPRAVPSDALRRSLSESRMPEIGCPVVCPAKAGMFSRGQTCRGRSQSPVVWIAEVMETETLKPIDKVSQGRLRVTGP